MTNNSGFRAKPLSSQRSAFLGEGLSSVWVHFVRRCFDGPSRSTDSRTIQLLQNASPTQNIFPVRNQDDVRTNRRTNHVIRSHMLGVARWRQSTQCLQKRQIQNNHSSGHTCVTTRNYNETSKDNNQTNHLYRRKSMPKKLNQQTGLRVRSQLKAGFDKCEKCYLGCLLTAEIIKKEICYAVCKEGLKCEGNPKF